MIRTTKGDILSADAEALVNTVNCVGVSGRGIALAFRKAFPLNFKAYEAACKRGEVQPGRMFVFETRTLTNPRYIINFPTQRHWRGKSRLADIEAGLEALVREVRRRGIRSLAVPPLGSGLGGLEWAQVRPRIEAALTALPELDALLFEPWDEAVADVASKLTEAPEMTPGRAVLVGLMHRYLGGLMDPFISLLEVHKLMYFMQEAGEPLRLRYSKGHYGPYAENLRHVLARVEGHLVAGYRAGSDDPQQLLELVPGAMEDAAKFLAEHPKTSDRFERVANLVHGYETPFGLELLSTVHWVATREGARTAEAARERSYSWNERKRRFSPWQIQLAWDALLQRNWIGGSS